MSRPGLVWYCTQAPSFETVQGSARERDVRLAILLLGCVVGHMLALTRREEDVPDIRSVLRGYDGERVARRWCFSHD